MPRHVVIVFDKIQIFQNALYSTGTPTFRKKDLVTGSPTLKKINYNFQIN